MVAFTPRLTWLELPDGVRAAIATRVADVRGAGVIAAHSLSGGFSPGAALRLDLDDGSRVFVKTTSAVLNPDSPQLYRRESVVAGHLPRSVPAPRLLSHLEHDGWIALVFEFVEGRLAHFPWTAGDWTATARTLENLARATTPAGCLGIPELAPVARLIEDDFHGWRRLAADPPAGLEELAGASLVVELDRLVTVALTHVLDDRSDALLHLDVRPDNILICADEEGDGPNGSRTERAVIVDWPWACSGPAWFDTLSGLVSVRHGEHEHPGQALSAATELATLPLTRDLDADLVTGILAGWAGFFLDYARRPPPPGLPTVRAFQRSQGLATLGWVRDRLSAEVSTS